MKTKVMTKEEEEEFKFDLAAAFLCLSDDPSLVPSMVEEHFMKDEPLWDFAPRSRPKGKIMREVNMLVPGKGQVLMWPAGTKVRVAAVSKEYVHFVPIGSKFTYPPIRSPFPFYFIHRRYMSVPKLGILPTCI